MKPPLFIVNPASGARRRSQALDAVLARARKVLPGAEVSYTAYPGHAQELARQGAQEGYPLLVAVGGDGTFSEVANGVLEVKTSPVIGGPAVGLIDLGTGGDFRRSLGLEPGPEACLEALATGRERLVDVGLAHFVDRNGQPAQHYFVNVLSAGLGGLVDRYVEAVPSFVGGRAGYYLAALLAVAVSKEQRLQAQVTWQGQAREEIIPAYLVAVCNGRWFGGGMDVAPMARLDDGRLEVITVTSPTKPYLAKQVRTVYSGRHLDEPTVHHFPCERIELAIADPKVERRFFLDVDGEALGTLPLRVQVLPRRLRLRC